MLLFVWERRASCWQRPRGALDLFCGSVVVRRGVVKRGGGRRFMLLLRLGPGMAAQVESAPAML